MAIIGAEVMKAGEIIKMGEIPGAVSAGGGTDIVSILKEISSIFNSPLAQAIVARMQAGQPIAPKVSLGSGQIPPQVSQPQITQANLMEFLKNPEGQKVLLDGLKTMQQTAGDLKISQIISMFEGGKNGK